MKHWWFSNDNQPLSSLEANQKSLNTMQDTQKYLLNRCKKYNDSLVESSLSPRSHTITMARREECHYHYETFSECPNQVANNAARTDYSFAPNTFAGAFGHVLGAKVATATEPLYTEAAKQAFSATSDPLK